MLLRIRRLLCCGLLVPFIFISCKTTPPGAAPDSLVDGGTSSQAASQASAGDARAKAEEKLRELDLAREEALESGIQNWDKLPDRFNNVDNTASSARDKFAKEDYAGAFTDASDALERYRILKTIAGAHNLKQEADKRNFFQYDEENYQEGLNAGNSAVDFFDQGALAQAGESAGESVLRFTDVLLNGWKAYAEEKGGEAQEWRQAALDVRANVAVRDVYREADKVYERAYVDMRAGEHRTAADLFDQSKVLFRRSRDAAVDKRTKAEEALRQAEQKVSQSGENAKNALERMGGEE
jgi:hypothetical protein